MYMIALPLSRPPASIKLPITKLQFSMNNLNSIKFKSDYKLDSHILNGFRDFFGEFAQGAKILAFFMDATMFNRRKRSEDELRILIIQIGGIFGLIVSKDSVIEEHSKQLLNISRKKLDLTLLKSYVIPMLK